MAWNDFILEAMRIVWIADEVFAKDPPTWSKEEKKFCLWVSEGVTNGR